MITVAILTNNNEETIEKTLSSVEGFDEVIVLDSGSKDNTLSIAKRFKNVVIKENSFTTFGDMRNKAAAFASNDWILALDSDEVLSGKLIEEINLLTLTPKSLYSFPFLNYYNNKLVKWCGWYPESHIRLYNRKETKFKTLHVHEGLEADNLVVIKCKYPIYHYPYRSTEDFLKKMQIYSSLFAKQHKNKKQSSFAKAFFHGLFAFFNNYFQWHN